MKSSLQQKKGNKYCQPLSKYLFAALTLPMIMSCSSDDLYPIPFNAALKLPTEYAYEVMINCYCTEDYVGPHRLRIKNNEIVDYTLLVESEATADSETIKLLTIDALVERLNLLLEQDPVVSTVKNHSIYDFPIDVYIDVDARIADEEWGYRITNFKVIKE